MSVPRTPRGRVLVVDDERSVRDSYVRWLAEAGFEVAQASGGTEALQRLESQQIDAVLTDISISEMDGFDFLRRVSARPLSPPVILIFDTLNNMTAIRATELGAVQSLVKPVDPEALERTVASAVRLHRSRPGVVAAFSNRRGEPIAPSTIAATEVKNEFGRVLDMVIQGNVVVITKHDAPKAVLLSVEEFNALALATERKLETLSGEFDDLLARMQAPRARAGMKAAFDASPKQLGRAAVTAARKRD